jgi:hypothetical protein
MEVVFRPLGYIACGNVTAPWYLDVKGEWVSRKEDATLMHVDFASAILANDLCGPACEDGGWMKPEFVKG